MHDWNGWKRAARAVALALPLVWGTAGARAADAPAEGRVALWQLRGAGVPDDQAYQVQTALRRELESMLGQRLVTSDELDALRSSPEAQTSAGCVDTLECAVKLARATGAVTLLTGVVRAEGTDQSLELRAVSAPQERELGRVTFTLPYGVSERGASLREAVARLILPERHKGTLVINNWTGDLKLTLDGEGRPDIVGDGPVMRVPVRVGRHTVELLRAGKPVMTEATDVRFEEIMVFMAPAPGQVAARPDNKPPPDPNAPAPKVREPPVRIPYWVGPVVMAFAIPPALVGAALLFDLFYLGPAVLLNPSDCQPLLVSREGSSGNTLNPKFTPVHTCGSFWRLTQRNESGATPAVAGDLAGLTLALLFGVGILGAGGGLLLASILSHRAE